MNYTSEADTDLDSELGMYKSGLDKDMRNSKRGAFLAFALLVLMVAFIVWDRVRPDMSTQDGTVALITVLTAGFFFVLSMLAFVLLKLKHILERLEDLQKEMEGIDDEIRLSSLPEIDLSSDDQKGNVPSSN